jgi:hypothetical protein
MNEHTSGHADSDEEILRCDISDEALERAGDSGREHAVTWQFCTHVWYDCGWPQ